MVWASILACLALPPLDGFHVQGMAEDNREAFVSTEVGQPVPREQAFDSDDKPCSRGRNAVQKGLRGRLLYDSARESRHAG
jgi:hypothetical protein